VNFRNNNGTATAWSWDFGDGSPVATTRNPTHQYSSAGKFSVSLTVSTAGGCTGTITKTDYINIEEPQINITNAPGGGCAPFVFTPVKSITTIDGIRNYSWNFGEGAVLTIPTQHILT